MTTAIFRYMLDIDGRDDAVTAVDMPVGARVLSVDPTVRVLTPGDIPCVKLWAHVDPDEDAVTEQRRFRTIPTGRHIQVPPGRFLGTVTGLDGSYVIHVFEDAPR